MKYYRVKYGYGKDEFISIDEEEVRASLIAQGTGQVAILKRGSIAGNHIIAVVPDYNRLMGYNRDHQLTGEDYDEIGTKKQEEHRLFLENTKLEISGGTRPSPPKEISEGVKQLARKANEPTWHQ